MKPDTHPENNKPENVQATDAAPKKSEADNRDQTQTDSATETSEHGEAMSAGPKAYVDPSIAAEARIAELEAQIAELKDKYVRAIAENDNLRKRNEREKSDVEKYAVTKFAGDMVTIADNLRRAIDAASASPEEETGPLKALLEGVALTDQELQKTLEKHGVRKIVADGEIFDPHKHQAVMEQDNSAVPAGTVLQVFQEGYQISDRVLRPSMVLVAKGGAKPVKIDGEADKTDEASSTDTSTTQADEQAGAALHDNDATNEANT